MLASRGWNASRLLDGLHQRDRAGRQLAERADHLGMAGVADQHDLAAALVMDFGLAMDLGDQRAGGVEREEIAALQLPRGSTCGTPWAEKITGASVVRNFGEFLDEDRALGLQALDHVAVVHDLVADVDRRAVARAPARPIRSPAPRRRRIRAASRAAP